MDARGATLEQYNQEPQSKWSVADIEASGRTRKASTRSLPKSLRSFLPALCVGPMAGRVATRRAGIRGRGVVARLPTEPAMERSHTRSPIKFDLN